MEIDLFFLRALGVIGMVVWFVVGWTTVRYFAIANGHRPLVIGLTLMSVLATIVTYGMAWTMFRTVDSVDSGWAGWALYTNRIAVVLMAAVVWRTGRAIFR